MTQPGRLVRHYFLISAFLISGGLITSGLLELYFRYQEGWEHLARLQHEVTAGAAFKIEQFITEGSPFTINVVDTRSALSSLDYSQVLVELRIGDQVGAQLCRLIENPVGSGTWKLA